MPSLRVIRRAHVERRGRELAAFLAWEAGYSHAMSQPGYWPDDDWDGDDYRRDLTCRHCDGTGGDPLNDGILPCEHCDGEGYRWWD